MDVTAKEVLDLIEAEINVLNTKLTEKLSGNRMISTEWAKFQDSIDEITYTITETVNDSLDAV